MKIKASLLIIAAAMLVGLAGRAQSPNNDTVQFGTHLTVANVVSALQSSGYQALSAPPTVPPGADPKFVASIISVITTGVGGGKVSIVINRCPNAQNDEICTMNFVSNYLDPKNVINDSSLAMLNLRASISKVVAQKKGDVITGYSIAYTYVCKGLDDPKFIGIVLSTFGADVANVNNTYVNVLTPAAAKP